MAATRGKAKKARKRAAAGGAKARPHKLRSGVHRPTRAHRAPTDYERPREKGRVRREVEEGGEGAEEGPPGRSKKKQKTGGAAGKPRRAVLGQRGPRPVFAAWQEVHPTMRTFWILCCLPLLAAALGAASCGNRGREVFASTVTVSATSDADGDPLTTGDQSPVAECSGTFDIGALIADGRDGGDVTGNRGRYDGATEGLTLVAIASVTGQALVVRLSGDAAMDYVDAAAPAINNAQLGAFAVEIECGTLTGSDSLGDPLLTRAVDISEDGGSGATSALSLSATGLVASPSPTAAPVDPLALPLDLFELGGTLDFTDLRLDPLGANTLLTDFSITLTGVLSYEASL